MKKLLSVIAALIVATPLMARATSPQVSPGKPDPAIVKVADAYRAAMKARDAAKVVELYTEDAVEMPPNHKAIKGRANIRKYYEEQFKGTMAQASDLTLQHLESRVAGDVGYDVGRYTQKITPKGGKPMDDSGNYVVILHQSGGQWRVAYAIYNSDLPPPGPAKQP